MFWNDFGNNSILTIFSFSHIYQQTSSLTYHADLNQHAHIVVIKCRRPAHIISSEICTGKTASSHNILSHKMSTASSHNIRRETWERNKDGNDRNRVTLTSRSNDEKDIRNRSPTTIQSDSLIRSYKCRLLEKLFKNSQSHILHARSYGCCRL